MLKDIQQMLKDIQQMKYWLIFIGRFILNMLYEKLSFYSIQNLNLQVYRKIMTENNYNQLFAHLHLLRYVWPLYTSHHLMS